MHLDLAGLGWTGCCLDLRRAGFDLEGLDGAGMLAADWGLNLDASSTFAGLGFAWTPPRPCRTWLDRDGRDGLDARRTGWASTLPGLARPDGRDGLDACRAG